MLIELFLNFTLALRIKKFVFHEITQLGRGSSIRNTIGIPYIVEKIYVL